MSNFSVLPEDCIAKICYLAFTSPKNVCKAAIISRQFKSASNSDTVWERFLPSDYEQIISRSVSPPVYTTKRELYFYLCNSLILLDGGKLGFKMDKLTGKRCIMLSARKVSLEGADSPMHWKWLSTPQSRFPEVAELLKSSRLEIQAKFPSKMLSQETNYTVNFVYKLVENPHRYNFLMKSVLKHIRQNSGSKAEYQSFYLWLETVSEMGLPRARTPVVRMDGWTEIQLGQFFSGRGGGGEVELGFYNGDGLPKGGLVIEGIEVRPKVEITCTRRRTSTFF